MVANIDLIPIQDGDLLRRPEQPSQSLFHLQVADLGPVHMEVGDPGKVRYPASVG